MERVVTLDLPAADSPAASPGIHPLCSHRHAARARHGYDAQSRRPRQRSALHHTTAHEPTLPRCCRARACTEQKGRPTSPASPAPTGLIEVGSITPPVRLLPTPAPSRTAGLAAPASKSALPSSTAVKTPGPSGLGRVGAPPGSAPPERPIHMSAHSRTRQPPCAGPSYRPPRAGHAPAGAVPRRLGRALTARARARAAPRNRCPE